MADFFDVVLSQRAYRALRPDPVSDDLIAQILNAAVHAPSGENSQPWVFVVLTDRAARQQLADLVRAAWDGGVREFARQHLSERFFAGVERWATVGFGDTPVQIVVCGDTTACNESLLPSSIFPATQNLLLAAQALGLGSLLSTLPLLAGQQVIDLLGLPPHIRPMGVVSLGWPARPLKKPTRMPFAAKTFRNRYGNPW